LVEPSEVGGGHRLTAVIVAGIDHALHLHAGDGLELEVLGGAAQPNSP